MIDQALQFVLGELNTYFDAQFPAQEKVAVLASLSEPSGAVPPGIENKLVLSLVNLERETVVGSTGFVARAGNAYAKTNPVLYLNLYVLLSASFAGNYGDALKMLASAMGFLQAKQYFDAQNSATFPRNMSQLTMELVSLDLAELSTMWAMLGANYLPSALYKLRMITMQEGWVIHPIPTLEVATPKVGA